MEVLQETFARVPRSVLILGAFAIGGLLIWRSFRSFINHPRGVNEGTFKARRWMLFGFATLGCVFLWPPIFGLKEPAPFSHDLPVLLILFFLGFAGFIAVVIFILHRSYIRITPDTVEYYDGWRKRLCFPRDHVVSAELQFPGALLVVQCTDEENNFMIPLLAYSRAGLLHSLLWRSAMRM